MASNTETKISRLTTLARDAGLTGFVLGIKNGSIVSLQMENIPLKDCMEILIAAFHRVIATDLERNPQYTAERKAIYQSLATEFDAMIRSHNDRFIKATANEERVSSVKKK